jgi:opacity protein-like surface antigen
MTLSKILLLLLTASSASLALAGGGSYDDSNTPTATSSIAASATLQNIKLSDNFKGFALEFSGGYQDTDSNGDSSPKVNGVSQTGVTTSGFDDSDSIYGIGGSYNFAISEKYLLGIGFDYHLNDIDIGKSKATGGITIDWNEYELKDLFSVYIKPQLVIGEDKLIYAKLGYVSADLSIMSGDSEYVSSSNESMHGYTVGAGYKQAFSQSFFGFFEVNYTQFAEESALANYTNLGGDYAQSSDVDIDFYAVKAGIGYQF